MVRQAHDDGGAVGVGGIRCRIERHGLAAGGEQREGGEDGDRRAQSGEAARGRPERGADIVDQATVGAMDQPARESSPTIGDLGETAVLGRILPRLEDGRAALVGAGDDAAVVAAADGRFVVTTDLMVHGPDFRLAWSSPHDLGWKAAATNLTDVAAMGARPTALVVAIAAPPSMPVSVLEGIADGLRDGLAALAPGAGVVGGDLSASSVLTIAVTAFGDLEGRAPVLRSGARPGDVLAHAGRAAMPRAVSRCCSRRRGMPRASPTPSWRRRCARGTPTWSGRSWRRVRRLRRGCSRRGRARRRCWMSATGSRGTRDDSPRRAESRSTSTGRRSATTR
ncbi:hypothetical protein GCM10025870_31850 [Agromyces marinus]|uniref:PurM-like N-terminal domain-containing protein n=1 Tax=Agromyces marinus TaxID=1389020 RepID=A0ABM8H5L1_9MICO|nr:hypothetical protein GCM10025870_31850 [Agromyces marinus]